MSWLISCNFNSIYRKKGYFMTKNLIYGSHVAFSCKFSLVKLSWFAFILSSSRVQHWKFILRLRLSCLVACIKLSIFSVFRVKLTADPFVESAFRWILFQAAPNYATVQLENCSNLKHHFVICLSYLIEKVISIIKSHVFFHRRAFSQQLFFLTKSEAKLKSTRGSDRERRVSARSH